MNDAWVNIDVRSGVGWIKLNRPRALNSLNLGMVQIIKDHLDRWKSDDRVSLVCIYGEGAKGFCAGGDVRAIYDLRGANVEEQARKFFATEYEMDYEIRHYAKPILVYLHGIVMGGGVGISIGASHRVVTETTKWAMPEMNIGFFPDVGSSYYLNRMPGYVGRYLALTAEVITGDDVIRFGAADYCVQCEDWPKIVKAVENQTWNPATASEQLHQLLKALDQPIEGNSSLPLSRIDEHFRFDTVEEIVRSLRSAADGGDKWADQTCQLMLKKSPLSLKVALEQLKRGKGLSLKACYDMELNIAMNFVRSDDFYEGVRSVLVDKDHNPGWTYRELHEVTEQTVESFFQAPVEV